MAAVSTESKKRRRSSSGTPMVTTTSPGRCARAEEPVAAGGAHHLGQAVARPVEVERAGLAVVPGDDDRIAPLIVRQSVVHPRHRGHLLLPPQHVGVVLRQRDDLAGVGPDRGLDAEGVGVLRHRGRGKDRHAEREGDDAKAKRTATVPT